MNKLIKSELTLSTSTIEYKLSNVEFIIEDLINIFTLNDKIIKIGCNNGEIISEKYNEIISKNSKQSKKARKKLNKPKRYFNSQITCIYLSDLKILNNEKKSYYNVKLFSNGRIQIPGIITEDIDNIVSEVLTLLTYFNIFDDMKISTDEKILLSNCYTTEYNNLFLYFRKNKAIEIQIKNIINENNIQSNIYDNILQLLDEEIINKLNPITNNISKDLDNYFKSNNLSEEEVYNNTKKYIKIIMQNYKFKLFDHTKYLFDLQLLNEHFIDILDNDTFNNTNTFKYKLEYVNFNLEKSSKLELKFLTPNLELNKLNKLTTILIYGSGKCNISCNHRKDGLYFQNILNDLIVNNHQKLLYNKNESI